MFEVKLLDIEKNKLKLLLERHNAIREAVEIN